MNTAKELVATEHQDIQVAPDMTPMQLISEVIKTPGFDVATLEKMVALQERWEDRQAEKEYSKALAEFQGEIPTIPKTKSYARSGGRISYAPLDEIMDQIRPHLKEWGLSVRFDTKVNKMEGEEYGYVQVKCYVTHSAGHTKTTDLEVPVDRDMRANVSQKMGSALSYAKRYALSAALNLVFADDDDDCQNMNEPPPIKYISKPQAKQITEMVEAAGEDMDKLIAWCKAESLETIPANKYTSIIKRLNEKIDAKNADEKDL
jgi:hypothetical protein